MTQMLSELLMLPPQPLIAIVGAGGKTTTLYTLARELAEQGKRVVTTTTTNIYVPEGNETETLIIAKDTPTMVRMVNEAWGSYRRVTVGGAILRNGKVGGVQREQPSALLRDGGTEAVIVEADGARHRIIKAPAEHEPAVPLETNVALVVMSAEAIGQPLSEEVAHRPERIAKVLGMQKGDVLTAERVARLLTSVEGGMKGIPERARMYVLITHVTDERKEMAREVARLAESYRRDLRVLGSEVAGEWFGL